MYQCMDCHAWMDVDYVVFHSRGKGNLQCPKCDSKSLYFHEPVESYCGQPHEILVPKPQDENQEWDTSLHSTVEFRIERFMQVLEDMLAWEIAA